MSNNTIWLTRPELSTRTKLSPKTLANWAAQHPPKGPRFTRFGNRVRYRLDDVIAWEAEQTDVTERRVA
ncbi:AlpA family transcriptional regulator [Nocardia sp. CC227C]|uniref:helix-turn-helix transcriptional regulator n=1 Tax=Nocardia sp. CC227C TaxID=3044562 RepID=UPI00278C86F9|nr:helix-turn-helix domain-containing protein [Nocardia sp. CC227C]